MLAHASTYNVLNQKIFSSPKRRWVWVVVTAVPAPPLGVAEAVEMGSAVPVTQSQNTFSVA